MNSLELNQAYMQFMERVEESTADQGMEYDFDDIAIVASLRVKEAGKPADEAGHSNFIIAFQTGAYYRRLGLLHAALEATTENEHIRGTLVDEDEDDDE